MSFSPPIIKTPQSYSQIIYDVFGGVKIAIHQTSWFVLRRFRNWKRVLGIVNENSENHGLDVTQSLKVVGVGYGRTGTYSLSLALNQLGYPALHTQQLHESPDIMDMWYEKVFHPAIQHGEFSIGNPDFDVITNNGFTATVDLPMALYFKEINERYPECKFILTTRSSSEEWFRSFNVMAISVGQTTNIMGNFIGPIHKLASYWRWMLSNASGDSDILKIPIGKPIPPPKKLRAISSYEEHNRRVRETIPAERLLEYNVKQGWEPLCNFLEINECPTEQAFPRSNSRVSLQAQNMTSVVFFLTIFMLIVFPLVAVGFEKATGKKIVPWVTLKVKNNASKKAGKPAKFKKRQ